MNLANEPDITKFKLMPIDKQINWIVQNYLQDLYWTIRPIVKTHENTNDILQNVLIKVYQYLPKFRYDSKLYSWLYRIAVNESLNFIKKTAKMKAMDTNEMLMQSLQSDIYYEGDKILMQLEEIILSLPPKQQEVFRLKYFNEMTYEEMSELLGTSIGALKTSYHIAVKKIKEKLQHY